jgi:hypothetical protein
MISAAEWAVLDDADTDAAVALPRDHARELAQALHDQGHGLVLGNGMIDLNGGVARRQLQDAALGEAKRGLQPRRPKIARRYVSAAPALVRNGLPDLTLHRLTLGAILVTVKNQRPIFA